MVFATEPIAFALRDPLVDLEAVEHLGWGVALWMKANDPQDLHDAMMNAGVPILVAPFDGPFGLTFTFADPDGYAVTIHGLRIARPLSSEVPLKDGEDFRSVVGDGDGVFEVRRE